VFNDSHLKKMAEGIKLFNEQKYWECHEALEDVWMEDRQDPTRNVYWAVIQVAAACIHYRDQNLIGARGMISKSKEKFKRCRDLHLLTDLAFKYLDWEEFERLTMAVPEGDKSQLKDFSPLFDFRFKHYPEAELN
jgi:predicted metal-dependent hydrolase